MKRKEAKMLDFTKDHFIANGKKYIFCFDADKFGLERALAYQKLEPIVTFSKSFDEIYKELNASLDLINKQKIVEGYYKLYDLKLKIAHNLEDRADPVLKLCCLFIVTEDEDLTVYNESSNQSKIEDWKKEGINYTSFFQLALNFIPKFFSAYREILEDSLKKTKKEKSRKQSTKN